MTNQPSGKLPNWNVQKSKLKAAYPQLDDSDLTFTEGAEDSMLNHLQIKLGKTKIQLAEVIASL